MTKRSSIQAADEEVYRINKRANDARLEAAEAKYVHKLYLDRYTYLKQREERLKRLCDRLYALFSQASGVNESVALWRYYNMSNTKYSKLTMSNRQLEIIVKRREAVYQHLESLCPPK